MTDLTVVYDGCVLYPAPLRDFLMHAALTDLYRAKWTDQIHEEWIRNLLKNRSDLSIEQLTRTRNLMNASVRDCLVTGYEGLIRTLKLPDPDDRHVLAAAIWARADINVTLNLKDFPDKALEPYGIEAQHPDDLLDNQFELASDKVCLAAKRNRMSLKNPPKNVDEYLATLEAQGLGKTASRLRQFAALI
ncbi:PIN domain-containing protein [Singulisphaera sp. PoT]|uniref:PIN domain-containing protein n=1 Tax=Singulisphaera sp. PoT TaxID=3411797 RepID=UPI003BF5F42D